VEQFALLRSFVLRSSFYRSGADRLGTAFVTGGLVTLGRFDRAGAARPGGCFVAAGTLIAIGTTPAGVKVAAAARFNVRRLRRDPGVLRARSTERGGCHADRQCEQNRERDAHLCFILRRNRALS